VHDLTADLGHAPSVAEATMIRQAASLIALSEIAQAEALDREKVSAEMLGEMVRGSHAVARILSKLGIKRGSGNTPTLAQYLAEKDAAR
jgi:hypothetical protein